MDGELKKILNFLQFSFGPGGKKKGDGPTNLKLFIFKLSCVGCKDELL